MTLALWAKRLPNLASPLLTLGAAVAAMAGVASMADGRAPISRAGLEDPNHRAHCNTCRNAGPPPVIPDSEPAFIPEYRPQSGAAGRPEPVAFSSAAALSPNLESEPDPIESAATGQHPLPAVPTSARD